MDGAGRVAVALLFLVRLLRATTVVADGDENDDAKKAKEFLEWYYPIERRYCEENEVGAWNYDTDIRNATRQAMLDAKVALDVFDGNATEKAEKLGIVLSHLKNESLRRQMSFFVSATNSSDKNDTSGSETFTEAEMEELPSIIAEMSRIYSTTTICDPVNKTKCDLHLDPDVTEIMANSRNNDELLSVWKEWHEKSGRPIRRLYPRYVELMDKKARSKGDADASQMWLSPYESETIPTEVKRLWSEVRPLYLQLHAYVRRKLAKYYGERVVRRDRPIPAHLLGNMWAQTWQNIENLVLPFPSNSTLNDVDEEMKKQNYTVRRMFEVGDDFYKSMGLIPLPETFWNRSMLVRPEGKEVVCHGSAFNMCDGKDFRIKMCTRIVVEDLITIHHEMGHVQYYMQYRNQPLLFQNGANPGFHEAIGDTMVLSSCNSQHLHKIGLLPSFEDDEKSNLNSLMRMALKKIAFLPFGYLIDHWRWRVFKGDVTEKNYNAEWWKMRTHYQGIESAVPRSEVDFDPGAKYHVVSNTPYLRYFISYIIQFQFHRSLCLKAGQFEEGNPDKPLHKCDLYNNKAAGLLFSKMLQMGSSRPWTEAMAVVTEGREKTMNSSAIVEYFKPLMKFLREENEKNGEYIGWKHSTSSAALIGRGYTFLLVGSSCFALILMSSAMV